MYKKPNIVIVIMDCVRADHLGCYGYNKNTSPFLDQVAAKGVLYERAISPAVWTYPSIASMFTGLYPSQHGLNLEPRALDPRYSTLPEYLKQQGYFTVGFSTNPWISKNFGFDRGFEIFKETWSVAGGNGNNGVTKFINDLFVKVKKRYGESLKNNIYIRRIYQRLLHRLKDKGAKRVNEEVNIILESKDEKPVLLFLHYIEPHGPYNPPEPYLSMFINGLSTKKKAKDVEQDGCRILAKKAEMTEHDFEILNALYDAEIAYMDSMVNNLVEVLKQHGMRDDTLLIITADHGQNIGDHDLVGHWYCVYNSLVHVPLIVSYPKEYGFNTQIKDLVQTNDIFATIHGIIGKCNGGLAPPGYSLLPDASSPRQYAYSEYVKPHLHRFKRYPDFDPTPYNRTMKSIWDGQYKFIWNSDLDHELYNVVNDYREKENLIMKMPDVADRLLGELNNWIKNNNQSEKEITNEVELDEAVRERLRNLGYLE